MPPRLGRFDGRLQGLPGRQRRLRGRLADREPVEVKVENGRPQLVIARPIHDPMATTVVVEIEGDKVER